MITVDHLSYRYPIAEQRALEDISLAVEKGETLGVMGANGAGKSTLCYSIMGLVPHFYKGTYGGDVTVDGTRVRSSHLGELVQHVAMVFQDPLHQFSGSKLTVQDEIAFGMENLGIDREEMFARIDWVTKLLGINGLLDRNPYALSGGQMQRVAIASVMAMKPKILILDEPTSQLDPSGTQDVFEAVRILQKEGMTTVVAEHKSELLVQYCDRICVLADGKIVGLDEPKRLFRDATVWGIETPRYAAAYRFLFPEATDVPVTLEEAAERLKADA